jgi:hypothetical protein
MKWGILILFLFSLLDCSKKLSSEECSIVQTIISYPHSWIGFTDGLKIRDKINSLIINLRPLPMEFRKRKFLLLYNYDKIKILKAYFQIQTEDEHLKAFLDTAEEYYQIFFKKKNFHSRLWKLSAWDIMKVLKNKSQNIHDDEDVQDNISALILVQPLIHCKRKLKSTTSGEEADGILKLVKRIMNDIKSSKFNREKYITHIGDLRFHEIYSSFRLIEHGRKEDLFAQLDRYLDEFSTGSYKEEMRIFISYCIIIHNFSDQFNLLDYIREKFAVISTLLLDSSAEPEIKEEYLIKYERFKKIHRHFLSKRPDPDVFRSDFVETLCMDLRENCQLNNFDEISFTTFYEICHSTCPEILKALIPNI